jgi:hypothetical protein
MLHHYSATSTAQELPSQVVPDNGKVIAMEVLCQRIEPFRFHIISLLNSFKGGTGRGWKRP